LPLQRQDTRGNLYLVSDGAVAPEGAQWDSPVAVVFETPAGSLTYDLGQPLPLSSFYIQADANDSYKIFGSLDGTPASYRLIIEIDTVSGHGLRGRTATVNSTLVRYLRIGEGLGDNFYSLSEFQAFCQTPTPFPPSLRVVDAPPAQVVSLPWYKLGWWNNEVSSRVELGLALAGLALLGWGLYLRRKGTADHFRKLRDGVLIALGVLSFGAYWNFGSFHFGNYVHVWDTFHYYVGSKYFNELSYDRLYDCVSIADSEDPRLRRRVELRKIMNLRTNVLGNTTEVLAHPEACKKHFSTARWEDFKKDVAYFRGRHGVKRWEEAQTDHGYNGTPVWNIVGTTLANLGPATNTQITLLTMLDPAFAVGMMGMIWWAFGWRVLCVGLIVFGTNFPSRFYWTGGSFLRWDWLFYLVGGICFIKREKYLLGGFFIAYSTLLRIFPLFLFVGPTMVAAQQLWKARRIERRYLNVFAGAALAVALLVPISLATSGGIDGYRRFAKNTSKHKETPLTNYMGLRTVVAYKASEIGKVLRTDKLEDPWGAWKEAKLRTFKERRWLYVLAVAGFMALLWKAVRGAEPWVAYSLSAMLIAVGVELTCYYYSFLIAVALLYEKRREVGAVLVGVTAATGIIDWAPTRFLPDTVPWSLLRMPTWLDEQYMWMSVATLAGFAYILYRFGYDRPPVASAADSAPNNEESAESPEAPAGKKSQADATTKKKRKKKRKAASA
jgi:hypothetical protein